MLALLGWYFAHAAGDMSYLDMIHKGKDMIKANYGWIILGLAAVTAVYLWVHHKVMHGGKADSAKAGSAKEA